jgi:glycosyltransferase involved in cell wall biosynthesis
VRVLLACDRLGHENGGLHGAGRCMVEWTRGLMARGVEVTPVILRAPASLQAAVEGLPFVFLQRSSFDPRTVLDLLSLIRRREIQVLHLQGHGCSMLGRLAARVARRPAIVHAHADYRLSPKGYPWYVRLADRALARSTALPISVSEHLVTFMAEEQGFRREQIEVIRNPVDRERFRPATGEERVDARAALGLGPTDRVTLALGRLDRLKGIDVLLEAWRALAERHPSAVLLLAGDGPERASLERWAQGRGLRSVRFLGQRSDVRSLLWAADVLAMPSRQEAMPMAALEALACGVPVVGSRVGGIPEIVRDGENGILVPAEDAGALARALDGLLSDPARRNTLSDAAGRLIAPYGLDVFAERLEARYRDLVARAGPR